MVKFGLALGGGGARGLAHIGVLKVLEREKINFFAITGCSMGSVIGGLYAYYGSATAVEEKMLNIIENTDLEKYGLHRFDENGKGNSKYNFEHLLDIINTRFHALMALKNRSYFDEETTDEIFSAFPHVKLKDLKIKFSAIATDLISGEEINLTEGDLRTVIRASSAIPGIFPPVQIGKMLLVDGAASESVPVRKVKELGADRVLAVNVTRALKQENPPGNLIEILYRSQDITSYHLSMERLKEADLIIEPTVKDLNWTDFEKIREIIRAGEVATENAIDEIKKLYRERIFVVQLKNKLKKFFS